MKAFNGLEAAQEAAKFAGGERLPAGAYVCEIKNVQYVVGENGNSDRIDILYDITEGDYKDFFKNQYDANTSEDKKWKGRKSIYVPKDDGSEKDEWTIKSFAGWINGFEDSNSGYKWDWKESKWKGLKIGIVFGDTGTVLDDGKEIVFTEPRFAVAIKKVQNGTAPKAKFIARKGYTGNKNNPPTDSGSDFMAVPDTDSEEIPFD